VNSEGAAPTLIGLFLERVARDGDRPALWLRHGEGCQSVSWRQLDADARRLAVGLMRWGVQPRDRVAQVSENRYEWIVVDLAIQLAGAVHVPAHAALSGTQLAQQIAHCDSRFVLLSNEEQAAKLARAGDRLPAGLQTIAYERCRSCIGTAPPMALSDLLPQQVSPAEIDEVAREARARLTPESLATILYTSGTTSQPKGVMLTQGNLAFNALATPQATGECREDVKLCVLPLSHSYARTCDVYIWIACGNQLALAESRDTVLRDCRAIRPTWINGVPYLFDKVRRQLVASGQATTPESLREVFGGRIRSCQCGGAPVSPETFTFYWDHGVPLYPGYGLTEASPVVSVSSPAGVRPDAVGRPIGGIELQVAEDGEILTRGPHVMAGYWNDLSATAETLVDGWLRTGDLGHLDADGLLCITGRKKELIVTTGGKKIAPALVESLLLADPLIAQVCVVGEGRDYLTALVVPHVDELRTAMGLQLPDAERTNDWLRQPTVLRLYAARLAQCLAGLSRYEQVRRFAILEEPFAVETGELTLKLSLRRLAIAERHGGLIERLYAPDGLADGRIGEVLPAPS
jgi:long-chain acyl-CoA synthetase